MLERERSPARSPAAVLLAVALGCAACSVQSDLSRQLLQPPADWLVEPQDLGLAAEPFEIVLHSEASLTGFWIPHPAAEGRTVVLLPEERVNASAQHPYYTFLHEGGFNVLVVDPRGYGKSRGTPTLQAWLHDLDEVFDWLDERPDVDPEKVALFGTSLGSVAAMWAARTHPECCAVVFEHLPSLRDMLREAIDDDGSAISAYSLGVLEFTGLPENIEPSDNAPRVEARALFIAGENELERNRRSLLRAYSAYAGEKDLWIVPGTGQAPHAMLTHDGEYQRTIVEFLDRAFDGRPRPLAAAIEKTGDASDGQAWYEVRLDAAGRSGAGPLAVEACAVLADGAPRYVQTWVAGARGAVRVKLPAAPAHVTATRVTDAVADGESVFTRRGTHLSRSGAAVAPLWPRIEELRNDRMNASGARELADALEQAAAAEPFHPTLESELADVFAKIGLLLDDDAWRRRAVAAVPEHPERHFWPGPVATYGFPQMATVDLVR